MPLVDCPTSHHNRALLPLIRVVTNRSLLRALGGVGTSLDPIETTVNRLAGLQGAIWQVVNPGYSVVSGNGALDGYIAAYSGAGYASQLTGYGPVNRSFTFITETGKYGTNRAHQSFAIAGVPEPATWSMMIMGFGMMGAMARRSRTRLVLAAARG